MSEQEDQPRVKRSRFDTSGDGMGAPAAPAPKPAVPTSEGAKAALEKARKTLETKKKLAETLAKLKNKKASACAPWLAPMVPSSACKQQATKLAVHCDLQDCVSYPPWMLDATRG